MALHGKGRLVRGMRFRAYVTVHEKTKHIAQKMILELRVPWQLMFELPFKFEVPRPCSLRYKVDIYVETFLFPTM